MFTVDATPYRTVFTGELLVCVLDDQLILL